MSEEKLAQEVRALTKELEFTEKLDNAMTKKRMESWNNNLKIQMMIEDFVKGGEQNFCETKTFLDAIESICSSKINDENEKDKDLEEDLQIIADLEVEFDKLSIEDNNKIEEETALAAQELAMKQIEFDRDIEENEFLEQKAMEIKKEILELKDEINTITIENVKINERCAFIDDDSDFLKKELEKLKLQYDSNDDTIFELRKKVQNVTFNSAWFKGKSFQ